MSIWVDVLVFQEINLGVAIGIDSIEAANVGHTLQRNAHPDLQLQGRDIDTSDALCNRMFHLETRVQLKEVEALVFGLVQVLHSAGSAVSNGHGQSLCSLLGFSKIILVGDSGRSLLEDFLESTLGGAVTTNQRNHLSILVADELDLQMPGSSAELHHEDGRSHDLGCDLLPANLQFLVICALSDALAASTLRCLEHDWVADASDALEGLLVALQARLLEGLLGDAAVRLNLSHDAITIPRNARHLRRLGQDRGGDLVAQGVHHRGRGTHEDDARL
mmetsp:Transcript_95186/g.199057  ORF Transcript_95186/g.199057 Transcript_95186/m.199057 type:complete len:276 (+) Transcript_95186:2378-3205(+)